MSLQAYKKFAVELNGLDIGKGVALWWEHTYRYGGKDKTKMLTAWEPFTLVHDSRANEVVIHYREGNQARFKVARLKLDTMVEVQVYP